MNATIRGALLLLAASTLLAAGCTDSPASPTPAAMSTPAAAPPQPTASPSASASASATLSRTPTATGGGPISSATPPAGYAQSCAKDVPWGRQVSRPFICLEAPLPGTRVARGAAITVRGYAGGSFENNVVSEVSALIAGQPSARLVWQAATYAAPDIGMPGAWTTTLTVPADAPPGAARVIAHFDSPRDGSVVVQATVDIVVD